MKLSTNWKSIAGFLITVGTLGLLSGCGGPGNVLTIYTSVDRDYSSVIISDFEDQHPELTVNAVYDNELTKTTGLYTKIQQEKSNPQADVFWNSEIVRTIQLKNLDLLQSYHSPSAEEIPDKFKDDQGYWTGFSARARVMIINTDLVPPSETPNAVPDLANEEYQQKTALAIPMFGTTATHMAALYTIMGREPFGELIKTLKANQVQFLQGNATVRDAVTQGQIAYGLTDTDDVFAIIDDDKPIRMEYLEQDGKGTLLIPNTISLIAGAPNPDAGKQFIDYMLSPEVEEKLSQTRARQIPLHSDATRHEGVPDLNKIKTMDVDFEDIAQNTKPCMEFLRTLID